jgi:TnpA family transposase
MGYRRRILQGLNKGESRNALAGDIRYANRGAFLDKDPELQLCAASGLNLAILCVAICNTIDMQKALRELRREGYPIQTEDFYGHNKRLPC